jgi:hypothetical protein
VIKLVASASAHSYLTSLLLASASLPILLKLTSALYINEDKRIDVTFHSSGLRLLSWKNLGCAIRTFNPMEPLTVDKLIPHPKPSGASPLRLGIRLRLSSQHSMQDGPMYRHSPGTHWVTSMAVSNSSLLSTTALMISRPEHEVSYYNPLFCSAFILIRLRFFRF